MFSRTHLTNKYRFEIVCLLPLLIFLFLFTLVTLVRVITLSFQPYDGRALTLSHYRELTAQPAFKLAFVNTVVIAGASLFLEVYVRIDSAEQADADMEAFGIDIRKAYFFDARGERLCA